jgi:hypothetical protein
LALEKHARIQAPLCARRSIACPSPARIIDAWVTAFPDKQLIMMSDNAIGLSYAMRKAGLTYPIGWRRDSWCNKGFESIQRGGAWNSANDRWKTAPVIIESYGPAGQTTSLGLQQIINYHVSAVGNGNFGLWSALSAVQQGELLTSAKMSGFRFVLQALTVPKQIKRGAEATFSARWSNAGVAPAYHNWRVDYRLTDQSAKTAWQAASRLDLRTLLPTVNHADKTDAPVTVNDSFVIPDSIQPGTYQMEIIVSDPAGYYQSPLKLAIDGRKADGAYSLGTVSVY